MLFSNYNYTAGILAQISDGGASADRINFYVANPGDAAIGSTTASGGSGGSVTGSTDIVNGVKHTLGLRYTTNNVALSVDGSDEASDNTADMPDDLDTMDVGQSTAGITQLKGLIQNFRIYKKPVKSG